MKGNCLSVIVHVPGKTLNGMSGLDLINEPQEKEQSEFLTRSNTNRHVQPQERVEFLEATRKGIVLSMYRKQRRGSAVQLLCRLLVF